MSEGKGKHLTLLHLLTNYTITDKPIKDMTLLQYHAIVVITNKLMKYKYDNSPMVVI